MTFRPISNLRSAAKCPEPPAPRAHIKGSGKKAAGLRYERQLAHALPSAIHGQWFRFLDDNGWGYCQPDFLHTVDMIRAPPVLLVLEAKYTWSPEAHLQLSQLYVPVVELALGLRTMGAVVCKNLRPNMDGCRVYDRFWDLNAAAQLLKGDGKYVWHWMGAPAYVRRRNPPLTVKPTHVPA